MTTLEGDEKEVKLVIIQILYELQQFYLPDF